MKVATTAFVLAFVVVTQSLAANNNFKPVVVFSGSNSAVRKPLYSKITSKGEGDKIWAAHLGTSVDDAYRSAFEVDFEKCLIVAILKGDQINVRGVQVDSLKEKADAIVLRFREVGYQTANESNREPDKPFAFVVLPKTSKQIVLEEDTQSEKDLPAKWTDIARLK